MLLESCYRRVSAITYTQNNSRPGIRVRGGMRRLGSSSEGELRVLYR